MKQFDAGNAQQLQPTSLMPLATPVSLVRGALVLLKLALQLNGGKESVYFSIGELKSKDWSHPAATNSKHEGD